MTIPAFTSSPVCLDAAINYQALMSDGSDLLSSLFFDPLTRVLSISDDGTLIEGPLSIQIIGKISQTVYDSMTISITVLPQNTNSANIFQLPQVSLTVYGTQTSPTKYTSKDFEQYTTMPYKMVIRDKSLSFVKLVNQELLVSPSRSFFGTYQLQLVSMTTSSQIIAQTVKIRSIPDMLGNYPDVEATISTLSNSGLVNIDFNQVMKVPANVSNSALEKALRLKIAKVSGAESQVQFNWTVVSYSKDQPSGTTAVSGFEGSRLVLQIKFLDPLKVSTNVRTQ